MNNTAERIFTRAKDFKYISFDLFDTLIFRQSISYPEILEISSKYALSLLGSDRFGCGTEKFISDRFYLSSLLKGSTQYNTEEPPYDLTLKGLLAGRVKESRIDQIVSKVMGFELFLEKSSLNVIPEMKAVLERLHQNGNHLIIISDMYFRQSQIEEILDKLSVKHFFKKIYVSASEKLTKQTGNLFLQVLEDLNIGKKDIVHIGDNLTSDIEIPGKLGIRTILFKHRFNVLKKTTRFSQYRKICSIEELVEKVIGPIALSYFLEILLACRYYRANKLFFLSRDATLFYNAFMELKKTDSWVKHYFGDIDVEELALNRPTSLLMGISSKESPLKEIADYYLRKYRGKLTISDILKHIDLGGGNICKDVYEQEINQKNYLNALENLKQKYPDIEEQVVDKLKEKQQQMWSYLKQKGAVGHGNVIFADIGYSGTAGKNISDYLDREGRLEEQQNTEIVVLLLASNRSRLKNANDTGRHVKIKRGVLFHKNNLHETLISNYCWLEIFFKDDTRGSLKGYDADEKGVWPLFDNTPNIKVNHAKWLLKGYILREIQKTDVLRLIIEKNREDLIHAVGRIFKKPSKNLIEILKDFRQENNPFSYGTHPVIYETIWYKLPFHLKKMVREDYWLNGSLIHNGWGFLIDIYKPLFKVNRRFKQSVRKMVEIKNRLRKIIYAATSL